jgi:hypothetical protein
MSKHEVNLALTELQLTTIRDLMEAHATVLVVDIPENEAKDHGDARESILRLSLVVVLQGCLLNHLHHFSPFLQSLNPPIGGLEKTPGLKEAVPVTGADWSHADRGSDGGTATTKGLSARACLASAWRKTLVTPTGPASD